MTSVRDVEVRKDIVLCEVGNADRHINAQYNPLADRGHLSAAEHVARTGRKAGVSHEDGWSRMSPRDVRQAPAGCTTQNVYAGESM
jgi:hypothetical protein